MILKLERMIELKLELKNIIIYNNLKNLYLRGNVQEFLKQLQHHNITLKKLYEIFHLKLFSNRKIF